VRAIAVSDRSGMKPSNNNVTTHAPKPSKYQWRKLSVRSTTGAPAKRQRFADKPSATTDAAAATENPSRTRTNGNVILTNPLLMP
jgi:hypothetical protein